MNVNAATGEISLIGLAGFKPVTEVFRLAAG
jgi:hypothetical protein